MLQSLMRDMAVNMFGLITKLGLRRVPLFNRAFLVSYGLYKRYVEAGPIDRLQEFVPRGSVVVDVGANVGFFSLRFAKWVGTEGRVFAIEPEGQNCEILIEALRREQLLDRVDVVKAVASAEPGTAFLEINPLHPADHKLSRDGIGVAVHAVTIDALLRKNGNPSPSLIKIDVQGAEMLVLQGAASVLKSSRTALFVELHEEGLNKFSTSVAAILAYLSGLGYEAYWLARSGSHAKADADQIHAKVARVGYVDVLFLKRS